MTINETMINNATAENTAVNFEKKTNPQMTLDAVLEGMNQDLNEKVRQISDGWKAKSENRRNNIINNTRIGYVMSSRGYLASASLVIGEGADSLDFNNAKKASFNNKINVLTGIGKMIKVEYDKDETEAKNLIIYTQDSEARRVSGMIKRIREGSNEYLTKDELEYIMNTPDLGDTYRKVANSLFALLKAVHDKGVFNVRVTGSDGINGFQLTNYDLPDSLENKELVFKNGVARYGSQFVNVRGLPLNGKHKLIKNNGRIMVERKVDKDKNPENYYALQLLQIISKSISVKADNDMNNADEAAA